MKNYGVANATIINRSRSDSAINHFSLIINH